MQRSGESPTGRDARPASIAEDRRALGCEVFSADLRVRIRETSGGTISGAGDMWQYQSAGPGEQLQLDEHGLRLDVDTLYRSSLAD